MKKTIVYVLVLIVLLEVVLGLGVRPAKTSIEFQPGLEKEFVLTIVNNDKLEMMVGVSVSGELADYVEVSEKELNFSASEGSKEVQVKVRLPAEIPEGLHEVAINVEQLSFGGGQTYVAGRVVLEHKVLIRGPIPGKFLEGELNFVDGEAVVSLQSLGAEKIESVITKFYVEGEKVEEVKIRDMETGEVKEVRGELGVDYGEYKIQAIVLYDGKELLLEKELKLGSPEIEIVGIEEDLVAGEVNRLMIELENKWNKKLEDVVIGVEVRKDNRLVNEFETVTFEMEGLEKKEVEAFLDATELEIGEYELIVSVRESKENFLVEVKEEKREQGLGSWIYFMIGIGIGLIVLVIGYLYYGKRGER